MGPIGDRGFAKTLGPGLLFAGAAVGVSHLVQSTRAGAVYGLSLLVVIVAANIVKYPAFSFGPRFAAATGTSLLEGYRRQGLWALVVYGLLTLATMFTVDAAVLLVTAALAKAVFGLELSLIAISVGLLAVCAVICAVGKFAALDLVIKVVIVVLTLATVTATALSLSQIDWGGPWLPTAKITADTASLLWLGALIGWMPSAIDIAVWHSLWTLAKRAQSGHAPTVRQSLLDFKIGYWGTAGLAVCFALLGAGIVFGRVEEVPTGAVPFANMILGLYAESLGEWSRYLIGSCAFLVMFSTTLTVIDGFPRALAALLDRFRGPETPESEAELERRASYWGSMLVIGGGALLILQVYLARLTSLVDLATTISFLTAPILAIFNHRAIVSDFVPVAHRPGTRMVAYSIACIVILALFALFYIWLRFG